MNDSPQETEFVAQLTEIQLSLRLYVQSLLPGDAAAHDVVQQANATLWKKRNEFAPGTNFKAWAFSVARYEVLNHRKQQARDSRLVFGEELEQVFAHDLIERENDTERRHEALRGCLEKLRQQDRELLLHRYTATAGIRFRNGAGKAKNLQFKMSRNARGHPELEALAKIKDNGARSVALLKAYRGPKLRIWEMQVAGPQLDQWPTRGHTLLYGKLTPNQINKGGFKDLIRAVVLSDSFGKN